MYEKRGNKKPRSSSTISWTPPRTTISIISITSISIAETRKHTKSLKNSPYRNQLASERTPSPLSNKIQAERTKVGEGNYSNINRSPDGENPSRIRTAHKHKQQDQKQNHQTLPFQQPLSFLLSPPFSPLKNKRPGYSLSVRSQCTRAFSFPHTKLQAILGCLCPTYDRFLSLYDLL